MNTEKLTPLEEKLADTVQEQLSNGKWMDNDVLSSVVANRGLEALERRLNAEQANDNGPEATKVTSGVDENGWIEESWAAWRLVLRTGNNPSIVYFSRQPTYAETKAFARAASVPVVDAVVEERPE